MYKTLKLLSEPESQYQPLLPQYSLEDLQKAMGASDAEMAVLQQLGEASLHEGMEASCKEEEDWNETNIMDLDNQNPSSNHQESQGYQQQPPPTPSATTTNSRPPFGANHHLHNSHSHHQQGCQPSMVAAASSSSSSPFGQVVSSTSTAQLQLDSMAVRGKGNSSSLLAAHSGKEVVCPTCSCHFMGFPALQLHVNKVHNSNNSASSSSGSNSQHSGIKLKGRRLSTMSVHKPDLTSLNRRVVLESSKESRLICFMCQQILPSNLMCSHLVVEHSLKSADITKCTTLSGEPAGDGCVGGERLKNKMSSALGDLLDRAVNNLLSANKSGNRHQLSGGAVQLLTKLCAVRRKDGSSQHRLHPSAREILMKLKQEPQDNSDDPAKSNQQYKPHSCSICYQKFSLASLRNRHVLLTHTKPRNSEERFNDLYDYENDWREAPSPTYDSEPNGDSEARSKALLIPPKCFDCGLSFRCIQDMMGHRMEYHTRRRSSTDSNNVVSRLDTPSPVSRSSSTETPCTANAGCNHPHIVELNKPAKIGGARPPKEKPSTSSPGPSLGKSAEKESSSIAPAPGKKQEVRVPSPTPAAQTKRPPVTRRSAPGSLTKETPPQKKAPEKKETKPTRPAGNPKGRSRQSLPSQKTAAPSAAKNSTKKRPGLRSKRNSRVEGEETSSTSAETQKDDSEKSAPVASLGRTQSPSVPPGSVKRCGSPSSGPESPPPEISNPPKKARLTQLAAQESVKEKAQAALRELNVPRKNKETTARWTHHMTFTRSPSSSSPAANMSPSVGALSSQVQNDVYDFSDDHQVSSTSQNQHQLRNTL